MSVNEVEGDAVEDEADEKAGLETPVGVVCPEEVHIEDDHDGPSDEPDPLGGPDLGPDRTVHGVLEDEGDDHAGGAHDEDDEPPVEAREVMELVEPVLSVVLGLDVELHPEDEHEYEEAEDLMDKECY